MIEQLYNTITTNSGYHQGKPLHKLQNAVLMDSAFYPNVVKAYIACDLLDGM